MIDYKDMVWSYSRVSSYDTCPRQFYLSYISGVKGKDNAFAQFGSFVHELLESVERGEMCIKDAEKEYRDKFDERVTEKFPHLRNCSFKDKYYGEGLIYLKWYKGFPYKTEEVELAVEFEIKGYKVKGFIDLIVSKDGELIIIDHKSKGEIKESEKESYFRQLYIYSIAVEEKFKKEPIGLILNLFRRNNLVKEVFRKEEQEKACNWFVEQIEKIKRDVNFERGLNPEKDFFCNHICSYRGEC